MPMSNHLFPSHSSKYCCSSHGDDSDGCSEPRVFQFAQRIVLVFYPYICNHSAISTFQVLALSSFSVCDFNIFSLTRYKIFRLSKINMTLVS